MSRDPSWCHDIEEADRLLELAKDVIRQADEARAGDTDRIARERWFDAHIAASDLTALAGVHARLALARVTLEARYA